ncbi:hypothetical protein EYF80_021358 [Liparis tanakae]|uniref:Uncharacterized protein n=1 Tax=Liparis tanakae TaxID=230148 RepID=A0A4Z2HRV4_9TELE|nr:hypothetical protein EYF80_021358 [Liparis tanakae]
MLSWSLTARERVGSETADYCSVYQSFERLTHQATRPVSPCSRWFGYNRGREMERERREKEGGKRAFASQEQQMLLLMKQRS